VRVLLLIVGLAAGVAFVLLAAAEGGRAFWYQAWLVAVPFWLGTALGGLMLLLTQQIAMGGWGPDAAAPVAALTGTLPLPLLAFVPLGFALSALLPGLSPGPDVAGLAAERAPWISMPGLLARTGVIFVLWLVLASAGIWGRLPRPAAVLGLLLGSVSLVLFYVDWVLGLTPGWSAAIFPFAIAVALGLSGPTVLVLRGSAGTHGLGPWLCGGALFLLYLLFVQYLVIWSGNLPDQVTWYLARQGAPWPDIAITGFCLLGTAAVSGLVWPRLLAGAAARLVALALLLGEILVAVWMILPAFAPLTPLAYGLTALALVSLGGLWGLLYLSLDGLRSAREGV
jgi:hypothetical protein